MTTLVDATIRHQAEHHFLIQTEDFTSVADLGIHLRLQKAYEVAGALASGQRVLDLGCNKAYGSAYLAAQGGVVLGADVSASALEEASARFRMHGLDLIRVDGKSIPCRDNAFGLIVSFQVIE